MTSYNAQKPKVVLSIRVNEEDMEAAKKLADLHQRSISGEIRYLIKKELADVFGGDSK